MTTSQRRGVGSWIVIVMFLVSGVLHIVSPAGFLFLMPPFLDGSLSYFLIYASGVAEIVSAVGLLFRARWAPLLTVATLLAVWPANIWFAIDQLGNPDTAMVIIAWVRLPLQLLLIWWAWKSPVKTTS
jgi:uncharacterized membrane protein